MVISLVYSIVWMSGPGYEKPVKMTCQYDTNLTCFYVFELSIIVFGSNSYIDPYNPFIKRVIFVSIHMTRN